jgi:hypothetical protein
MAIAKQKLRGHSMLEPVRKLLAQSLVCQNQMQANLQQAGEMALGVLAGLRLLSMAGQLVVKQGRLAPLESCPKSQIQD